MRRNTMGTHRWGVVAATATLAIAACSGAGSPGGSATQEPTDTISASQRLTAHSLGKTEAQAGYYEYLPPGYGDGTSRPLLVSLHGYGGNGDGSTSELDNLLKTGIPKLIRTNRWPPDRPFVVLAPQHPTPPVDPSYGPCEGATHPGSCVMRIQHDNGHPSSGTPCATPAEVQSFLAYAIANYDVDPARVYLTGLSCGAYAAYEYLAQFGSTQIAGLVAIAGDARPAWQAVGCELGAVPLWAFHGDADAVVDPAGSTEPMIELARCPTGRRQPVQLTVYPGVEHDSFTRTYDLSAGHDIYGWLLSHTRAG